MDRQKGNSLLESVKHTLSCEAQEIERLIHTLDDQQIIEAAEMILRCSGKVILSGCGTSGTAGEKTAHTLSCIEIPAFFLSPAKAAHGGMGVIQREDVVILISKGGHTPELECIAQAVEKKGAGLITVTENTESFLARKSSLVLKVKVDAEPDEFGMLATASTLAVISTFDAIAIALAGLKGYTREEFLLIHPGGAVGEKLLEETR